MSEPEPTVEEMVALEEYAVSPLNVNVDFMQLVDRYGDEGAWEVLGKIKDFFS